MVIKTLDPDPDWYGIQPKMLDPDPVSFTAIKECFCTLRKVVTCRVADPHHYNADTDQAFHFDADPDPAFHFNADLNPDPEPAPHPSEA